MHSSVHSRLPCVKCGFLSTDQSSLFLLTGTIAVQFTVYQNSPVKVYVKILRYNIGRCTTSAFQKLNRRLISLEQNNYWNNHHVLGAMSRYDIEYLNHYLHPQRPIILSSLSGFYAHATYKPERPEILVMSHNPDVYNSMMEVKDPPNYVLFKKKYPKYSFQDLASNSAMVFPPYSVMSYKFTEFYQLGLPMFIPSFKFYKIRVMLYRSLNCYFGYSF